MRGRGRNPSKRTQSSPIMAGRGVIFSFCLSGNDRERDGGRLGRHEVLCNRLYGFMYTGTLGKHANQQGERQSLWSSHLLHSVSVLSVDLSCIWHERLYKCADDSEVKQYPVSVCFHLKLKCHSRQDLSMSRDRQNINCILLNSGKIKYSNLTEHLY